MQIAKNILLTWNSVVLAYFVALVASYLAVTTLSWFEVRRYFRRVIHARLRRSLRSRLTPPITLCVPGYNEESTIVDSIRSMLSLEYPQHEVVFVNDGSTDGTLERMIEGFELHRVDVPFRQSLETELVRGIYRSQLHSNLVVVDKRNGGKTDALNAAINISRFPLVCCVDADSILETSSLAIIVRPFVEQPDRTVAAAGLIRVANGCEIKRGHVVEVGLPKTRLPMFQTVEYVRAFTAARTGWSAINALIIISGAFGVFRKDVVIDVGGYQQGSIGEDFELGLRIHRRMRDRKRPYRIAFIPDPVCWTEVPERLKDLGGQRDRWHRGLIDTLVIHRRMIGNPRYGAVGLLALPFFTLFECLGALIECTGYVTVTFSLAFGLIDLRYGALFFAVAIMSGIFLSLSAMLLEDMAFRRFGRWRDFLRLIAYCVAENFGYRQLISFYRMRGFVNYVRGNKSWGTIERKGFEEEPLQPEVGLR